MYWRGDSAKVTKFKDIQLCYLQMSQAEFFIN